jgi:hypothetical protein
VTHRSAAAAYPNGCPRLSGKSDDPPVTLSRQIREPVSSDQGMNKRMVDTWDGRGLPAAKPRIVRATLIYRWNG